MTRVLIIFVSILLASIAAPRPAIADDQAELSALLDEFLAGASVADADAHRRFWAEELVYTSSAGVRTDRSSIIDSIIAAPKPEGPPPVVYSAEHVDIRLYDDMAVVAFELVGTPSDGESEVRRYLNTGTFIRRDTGWKAVAWHVTFKAETND